MTREEIAARVDAVMHRLVLPMIGSAIDQPVDVFELIVRLAALEIGVECLREAVVTNRSEYEVYCLVRMVASVDTKSLHIPVNVDRRTRTA